MNKPDDATGNFLGRRAAISQKVSHLAFSDGPAPDEALV